MLSKDEYREVTNEVMEYTKNLNDSVRHERGGTTLGEILDLVKERPEPPEPPEHVQREQEERDRRRSRYYARVEMGLALGEEGPDGFERGRWFGNWSGSYCVDPTNRGLNEDKLDMDKTPENMARLAIGEMSKRKLQNRIATLRESARLCGALADAMEERRAQEAKGIRRIQ